VDVLTNNPKAKMLELIKEWYQMYNMHKIDTDRNVAQFHKMTIEQKINNLRDFLKQKFQESGLNDDAFIDDYLQNKIDRSAFEKDDFTYGGSGKKKTKKIEKEKQKRNKNRNKSRKRQKKRTIKKY
jgi:hypothetical protein